VINRPPDEVFAFLTDPGNDLKWRPHIKEIAPQGPADVGSTIHQVLIGPGGCNLPADLEVGTVFRVARALSGRMLPT